MPRVVASYLCIWLLACSQPPSHHAQPSTDLTRPAAHAEQATRPAPSSIASQAGPLQPSTMPLLAAPLPADPRNVTVHRLRNGLTVYISPNPKAATIQTRIVVQAGAGAEAPEATGLAHYLEHMMFKGSRRLGTRDFAAEQPLLDAIAAAYDDLAQPRANLPAVRARIDSLTQQASRYAIPNELDTVYAKLGFTDANAYTSEDATIYAVTIPHTRLSTWAALEADRFTHPQFRLFWPELEAVYEEKNLALDSDSDRVYEALRAQLFPGHAYGYSSILGDIDHLQTPAYRAMVDFYHAHYIAPKMALILVGKVDATAALPALEQAFATLPTHGPATVARPVQAPQPTPPITLMVHANAGVDLAWQTIPRSHPDSAALEVWAELLMGESGGLLSRELLLTNLVHGAKANATFLREAGEFVVSVDALPGQSLEATQAQLRRALAQALAGNFSDADFNAAVATRELAHAHDLETDASVAALLETTVALGQGWPSAVAQRRRLRQLTRAEVQATAQRYLAAPPLEVRRQVGPYVAPVLPKPLITPLTIDAALQSSFAQAILALPPEGVLEAERVAAEVDYVTATTAQGEFVGVPAPRSETFTATLWWRYGAAHDSAICLALDALMYTGTAALSAAERETALRVMGLDVQVECSAEAVTIEISGLDRSTTAGLRFVADWLTKVEFSDEALNLARAKEFAWREDALRDPEIIRSAALSTHQYGERGWSRTELSNATLAQLTPASADAALRRLLRTERRMSYVGPRAPATMMAELQWGSCDRTAPPPPPWRWATDGNRLRYVPLPSGPSTIAMLWPRGTTQERALGTVFNAYYNGMQGVLFQRLREARGLAYGVSAYYRRPRRSIDEAGLWAELETQAPKTHDAMRELLRTLRLPIDPIRFANAQEALALNHLTHRLEPHELADAIYEWRDLGETGDPRAAWHATVAAVPLTEFAQWTRRLLRVPPRTMVVGPRAPREPAITTPPQSLFRYAPSPRTSRSRR